MVVSFNHFHFCLRAPPSGFGLLMTCDQTLSRYSWLTAAKPVDDGISGSGDKNVWDGVTIIKISWNCLTVAESASQTWRTERSRVESLGASFEETAWKNAGSIPSTNGSRLIRLWIDREFDIDTYSTIIFQINMPPLHFHPLNPC